MPKEVKKTFIEWIKMFNSKRAEHKASNKSKYPIVGLAAPEINWRRCANINCNSILTSKDKKYCKPCIQNN